MVDIADVLRGYTWQGDNLGDVSGPVDLDAGRGTGSKWWLKTQGPQMWALFAKWAASRGGPIDESTRQAFAEQVAGMTAGHDEQQRALASGSAAAGVSPSIYRQQSAESDNAYMTGVGQARAGSERARGEAIFNLGANTTAAINDEIARNKTLKAQDYIASQQRALERAAGKRAQLTSLVGAGLGALSFGLGGGWLSALYGAGAGAGGGGYGAGTPAGGAWSDSQHGGDWSSAGGVGFAGSSDVPPGGIGNTYALSDSRMFPSTPSDVDPYWSAIDDSWMRGR